MSRQAAEAPIPERQRLEHAFVRARWLGTAAVAVLAPLGGFAPWASAIAVLVLGGGNLAIQHLNNRVSSLSLQRTLGVSAVGLDAAVVLFLSLTAPEAAVNAVYGALFIVVAESAIRFVPMKATPTAAALVGGLALAMAARSMLHDEEFDSPLLGIVAVLAVLAGTMIGSVVREIYRNGVGTGASPQESVASAPELPEDALQLLTPRERQVLTLITQGYSNGQIAAALVVEQKTVKNHINNIYGKLRVSNRYQAITQMLGNRGLQERS